MGQILVPLMMDDTHTDFNVIITLASGSLVGKCLEHQTVVKPPIW